MMLRCPSCGARLRLKDPSIAARGFARCPQCDGTVSLGTEEGETLKIQCGSCGVRLKAPASSAGARSHCPRCRAEVLIDPATAAARVRQEQSSSGGASTRRMDSRMLGLGKDAGDAGDARPPGQSERAQHADRSGPAGGTGAAAGAPGGGMDLDAFIRGSAPAGDAPSEPATPGRASSTRHDVAAALMQPPVAQLQKAAQEIRLAAVSFESSASSKADAAVMETPSPPESRSHRASRSIEPAHVPTPEPFPAMRGLALGAAGGLAVGGAEAAGLAFAGAAALQYVAPLPLGAGGVGIPDIALQAALPTLLACMSGFMAAAAGSPSRRDRPLRPSRTLGFFLLTGLACGMVTSLSTGEGLQVWPMGSWIRDLLVAGLVTTALDRLTSRQS